MTRSSSGMQWTLLMDDILNTLIALHVIANASE